MPTGFDLLKSSLGDSALEILAPITQEAKDYFAKVTDGVRIKEAAETVKKMYASTEGFADEQLRRLADEIDPELAVATTVVGDSDPKKPSNHPPSEVDSEVSSNGSEVVVVHKQAPEKSDKNLLGFESAMEMISTNNKLSQLWVSHNKSIESLKDHEAVDKMQAAALIYVHNGINAGETVRHPLSPEGEVKLATVLAIELLQSMKLSGSSLNSMTDKIKNNPATTKMGFADTITNLTKGVQDSGVMDKISTFTSLTKVFNESKPILSKANTMFDLLREGASDFEVKNMDVSQLHQLYNLCGNGSFPTADQISTISTNQSEEQRYTSKLKTLNISSDVLGFLNEHIKDMPFADPESAQKTKELADATQQGMDAVYDVVSGWFGAEKGSEMLDSMIESLMRFFDNPFLGAWANMNGIDFNSIKKTLSGEFTPAQEEQFDMVMEKYEDANPADGDRVGRLSSWVSDTTSDKYKNLEKLNLTYMQFHLGQVMPHISVVQNLIGDDETLQSKYFTKSVDSAGQEKLTLNSTADFSQLAQLFCANDDMMKSIVDSRSSSKDMAGMMTAQWIKGDIRGIRAWDKYQAKLAKSQQTAQQKTQEKEENEDITKLPPETAIAVGRKIRGGATGLWSKDQDFKLIDLATPTKMGFGQVSVLGYLPYSKKPSQFMTAFDKISTAKSWTIDDKANVMLGFGMLKWGENRSNGKFNVPYADGPRQTAAGPWAFSRTVDGSTLEEKGINLKKEFHDKFFLPAVMSYGLDESAIVKDSQEYYAIGMLTQFESREGNFAGDKLGAIDSFKNLSKSMTRDDMRKVYGSHVQGAKDGHSGGTLYEHLQRPLSDFVDFSSAVV